MKLQNTTPKQIHSSKLHSFALFSIIFLLCQHSLARADLANQTDQLTLLEFKHQIANNPVFDSWNTSLHFCQWKGVQCGHRHRGRVIGLNLTGKNIFGTISPHIGNLSFLRFINLQNNHFHGEIPQPIGRLYRLRLLNLTNNAFGGPLPINLSSCLDLGFVGLKSNHLVGTIPIELGSLKKLARLNLATNNFSGFIPRSFGNLSSLEQISLETNNIEGTIPSELGQLTNLAFISVIVNNMSGSLQNLQWLNIEGNLLGSKATNDLSFITSLSNCTNLHLLDLADNNFGGEIRNSIGNLSFQLKLLDLGYNYISGIIPSVIENLSRLFVLQLENNLSSGPIPSSLGKLRNLQGALRNIRHRNLVKILTYCSSIDFKGNQFKALVYEFMVNGSLDMWLHPQVPESSTTLRLIQRLNIAIDVASAIHYLHDLHEPPIIHCDLKPSNILLDNDLTAHVSDFGLARLLSKSANTFAQAQSSSMGIQGSIGYAAPEYGMGGAASKCGDMYSYGILLLEMFTGRRPTDDMFKDGETEATTVEEEREGVDEIEAEQHTINTGRLFSGKAKLQKCIVVVLEIGLACSAESPKERMGTNDVLRKMHHIKTTVLDDGIFRN
ncbi:hypothetical protein LguiA_013322 [Lonicera macranthoides]